MNPIAISFLIAHLLLEHLQGVTGYSCQYLFPTEPVSTDRHPSYLATKHCGPCKEVCLLSQSLPHMIVLGATGLLHSYVNQARAELLGSLIRYAQGEDIIEMSFREDFPACILIRRILEYLLPTGGKAVSSPSPLCHQLLNQSATPPPVHFSKSPQALLPFADMPSVCIKARKRNC